MDDYTIPWGKIVLCTIIGLIGLFILGVIADILGIATLPFLTFHNKVQLNQAVINRTYDPTYCLQNYDWFKQQEQDIQATQTNIGNLKLELSDLQSSLGPNRTTWSFSDKQSLDQIQSQITGTENILQQQIADYNAKSNQLENVACKDLPLYIKP